MTLIAGEIVIHAVFLTGVGIAVLSGRPRSDAGQAGRTKLLFYYLVVQLVIVSTLHRAVFVVLTGAILLAGGVEILSLRRWVVPFLVFVAVGAGFAGFALGVPLAMVRTCYLLVAVFDFSCEIGGRVWGRLPLLPTVSPGKTREGLVTGVLCTLAVAVTPTLRNGRGLGPSLLFAAIVTGAAFSGDLLGSVCKRQNGIKDFSQALPGQGGVLDRFDSFLLSGVAIFLWWILGLG